MRLEILNQFNFIKQGDTQSKLRFKLLNYDDTPINLSNPEMTILVIIANEKVKLVEKTPDIESASEGIISFNFDNDDVIGFGNMRLEVHVTEDGFQRVIPSRGYYQFVVEKNLNDITGGVKAITLKHFEDQFNARVAQMETVINETQNAKFETDQAIETAYTAADTANEAATNADTKVVEIEERVNQAIAAGTNDLEVKDARGTHTNLRQRLDATDVQLAQSVQQANRALNYYWIPEAQPPARTDESGYFTDAFNLNSNQYIESLFEPLRLNNPDYITRSSLGKDASGLYDVWRYILAPKNFTKTILINTCLHGGEVTPMIVMARFLHYLVNEWEKYPTLAYIREHVRIVYIPFANPWGTSQLPRKRQNANGIDLNRNFGYNWDSYTSQYNQPFGHDYKGTAPMSEPEIHYLIKNIEEFPEAIAYLDFHNTGKPGKHYYIVLPDVYKYKTYDKLLSYFTRDIENPDVFLEQMGKPNFANYLYTNYKQIPSSHPEWTDTTFGGRKYGSEDLTKALTWFSNVIIEHCREFEGKERVFIEDTNITNMVVNGDFTNGTTGWSRSGLNPLTVTDGVASGTGTGGSSNVSVYGGLSGQSFSNGDKIFTQAKVKCPEGCVKVAIKLRDFTSTIDDIIFAIDSPTIDEFIDVSGIYTFKNDSTAPNIQVMYYFSSASETTGKTIELKEILAIDLTDNDANLEEIRFMLSQFDKGWFGGTENTLSLKQPANVDQYQKDFMLIYWKKLKELEKMIATQGTV